MSENQFLMTTIPLRQLNTMVKVAVREAIKDMQPERVVPTLSKYITINGLQDLLEEETGKRPAKQTIYGLVSNRKIPSDKPTGGRELRFNREKIVLWLNNGRQMNHLKEG